MLAYVAESSNGKPGCSFTCCFFSNSSGSYFFRSLWFLGDSSFKSTAVLGSKYGILGFFCLQVDFINIRNNHIPVFVESNNISFTNST
ncbi:unnamed protein product [Larinioides sclopetarius]|uniref:Uncharacterized protein n=1 Tax=Larinioides sclopetarius TaxID=280406 RepID=A0AAV1Z6Q0_9ARAC